MYSHLYRLLDSMRVLLYGGYALHLYLHPQRRFYPDLFRNEDSTTAVADVPDIDALCEDAIAVATRVVQSFRAQGYQDCEARCGVHVGTIKVFVEGMALVDLTELHTTVFAALWDDRQTLHSTADVTHAVVPIQFLRMSMCLELCSPAGDVSR